MWVNTTEADVLIENFEEDFKDRIFFVFGRSAAIDVEKDDICVAVYCCMDITEQHAVGNFLAEELDRMLSLTTKLCLTVLQQVGQDLDEVRLTATEEAGDPDTDLAGHGRIVGVLHGR